MGFWKNLFSVGKMNADPDQQELAKLLIENAGTLLGGVVITNWLHRKEWSTSEAKNRVLHAVSMAKVWRPDLYAAVKELGEEIYLEHQQEE